MNTSQPEISLLLKTISRSINKYGLRNLLSKLSEIEEKGINSFSYEMLMAIMRHVCLCYKIKYEKLVADNGNSERLTKESEARKMSYILIKKYINMSDENIARQFNRARRVVYRALNEFKALNTQIKSDKEFYDKYTMLTVKLDETESKLKVKYYIIDPKSQDL